MLTLTRFSGYFQYRGICCIVNFHRVQHINIRFRRMSQAQVNTMHTHAHTHHMAIIAGATRALSVCGYVSHGYCKFKSSVVDAKTQTRDIHHVNDDNNDIRAARDISRENGKIHCFAATTAVVGAGCR